MKRAFMVMPFSDDIIRQAYVHCIKPIFESKAVEIRKADEIFSTNPVYDDIVHEIQNAQIIVVDISGKNNNVFYELGIAHTLKQTQTIILTHDEIKEMPFDIAHFRIIHYDNTIPGSAQLKEWLSKTIDYILADYEKIYGEEYEIVMNTLGYSVQNVDLFAMIGLKYIGGVIKRHEGCDVEGHNKSSRVRVSVLSADAIFGTFVGIGYVKVEGDSIYLTDKGNGFVEHLINKGNVCDKINDRIINGSTAEGS